MKKLISLVIVLCLVLSFSTGAFAASDLANTKKQKGLVLSDFDGLSPEDSLDLLLKNGLKMQPVYENNRDIAIETVYAILEGMRNSGLKVSTFNYTQAVELSNRVFKIVEIDDKYSNNPSKASLYTLQDSYVVGSWNNSYINYNCYMYALGYTNMYVDPGYFSTGNSFSPTAPLPSVSNIATLIVNDLNALGYNAYKTTTKPTSLSSWEKVICVRRATTDYHVMKGLGVNNWYHKPGQTNPLNWKYTSPGYKNWTTEHSVNNVSYSGDSTLYKGTIYYIRYWSKTGPGPGVRSFNDNLVK